MPKFRSFFRYWLPVLLWMAIIFFASSDRMSFQHSSRIIGPVVHLLFPHLSEKNVEAFVFAVRKCAHVTEYAILALLIWRALPRPVRSEVRSWEWQIAWQTIFIVFCYAASDEFHQAFVPSREASLWDVLLDTTGAIIGMFVLWAARAWRQRASKSA